LGVADAFIERVADRLVQIAGVLAVHFGGSRAAGTAAEGADWDCSIYYRRWFDVGEIRALGWVGIVSEIGGWGPVMNGGAWLTVDGQPVDIHYRDLDQIDRLRAEATAGTFSVYRSPFFIAGIPSYIPLAELGSGIVLRGELRIAEFPHPLRRGAAVWWRREAELDLGYIASLKRSSPVVVGGTLSKAIIEAAHARLCDQGRWATNEKRIVEAAGYDEIEAQFLHRLCDGESPEQLAHWVARELALRPVPAALTLEHIGG
jgi:hypothetical protein